LKKNNLFIYQFLNKNIMEDKNKKLLFFNC